MFDALIHNSGSNISSQTMLKMQRSKTTDKYFGMEPFVYKLWRGFTGIGQNQQRTGAVIEQEHLTFHSIMNWWRSCYIPYWIWVELMNNFA